MHSRAFQINQESRRKRRGMNLKQIIAMRCKHQGIKPAGGIKNNVS